MSTSGIYYWDITEAFSRWSMGFNTDFGIAFKAYNDCACDVRMYRSSTSFLSMYRPILTVNFEYAYGLEGDFNFHSVDMGRAGTAYVNDYTGTLVVTRDEIGIDGNLMPVNISRIYDINHFNSPTFSHSASTGTGWQWDTYYSRLYFYSSSGTFSLCKSNGTRIEFTAAGETDASSGTKYANIDGDITLWVEPDATANNDYANINIDDGTYIYRFYSGGKLCSISDKSANANTCQIEYYGSTYSLNQVTDGMGRKYCFSHITPSGGGFQVSSITAKTANDTTITIQTGENTSVNYAMSYGYENLYSGKSRFASATYPDGETVNYTYDSNDNLVSMTNIDGSKLEFTYYGRHITSYTKSVYDSATQSYLFDSKVEIYYNSPTVRVFEYYDSNSTSPSKVEKVFYDNDQNVIGTYDNGKNASFTQYDANGDVSVSAISEDKTNIITNPAFTGATQVQGSYFYMDEDDAEGTETDNPDNGVPIYSLTGDPNAVVNSYQQIDISDFTTSEYTDSEGNVTFNLSAWAQSSDSSVIKSSTSRSFGLIARYLKSDSTLSDNVAAVNFDTSSPFYQYCLTAFTVPAGTQYIYIYFSYAYQTGTVIYSDVQLYQSDLSNVYNNEEIDDNPQGLVVCVCGDNCKYGFGCPCTCATEAECHCVCCHAETTTAEDDNGNVTSEINTDGTKSMTTINTYTSTASPINSATGNYLASTVDSSGNSVYYDYNEDNGLLDSVSYGSSEVNYTYNAIGALSKVSQTVDGLTNGTAIENSYGYTDERISSITHNGNTYNFEYDVWGNGKAVKVGTQNIVSYDYSNDYVKNLNTITYGNGDTIDYTYSNGNVTGIKLDNHTTYDYTYEYDTSGKLASFSDNTNGTRTDYTDNGFEVSKQSNNELLYSFATDENSKTTEQVGSNTIAYNAGTSNYVGETGYTTSSVKIDTSAGSTENSYTTDYFGRTLSKNTVQKDSNSAVDVRVDEGFLYDDTVTTASTKINGFTTEVSNGSGSLRTYGLSYEYDANGNITEVYNGLDETTRTLLYKYTYDEANQLIREDSSVDNKSYTYTYDKGGNIASKSEYAYTTGTLGTATDTINYSYNNSSWKDKLTSYDGKAITYDEIGNPLVYDDVTYSWRNRQLIQYTNYENDVLTIYKYNAEGLMTRKGVLEMNSNNSYATSRVYEYYWSDNTLIGYKLVTYNIDNGSVLSTSYIQCLYSQNDEAIGFIVNSTSLTAPEVYYYVKNLQGDITEIVDETGAKVVSYTYDAWGNMASYAPGTSDAEVTRAASVTFYNPFFYRGYLLDKDTGYYYLQSRFYNPEWGRFLNADVYCDTGTGAIGTNMFAYCDNAPVNNYDPSGFRKSITVNFYSGNGGHCDISFGGLTYSYGAYIDSRRDVLCGNGRGSLIIASNEKWMDLQRKKGREITKIWLDITEEQRKKIEEYYEKMSYEFYDCYFNAKREFVYMTCKVISAPFNHYNLVTRNCVVMVIACLCYALGENFASLISSSGLILLSPVGFKNFLKIYASTRNGEIRVYKPY